MPELPEVETIKIQLNQALKGLKIVNVEVLKTKSFQGKSGEIIGKKILGVGRRAKIILIELAGNYCLAIHLKLTGQLIYRKSKIKNQKSKVQVKNQKVGPFEVGELPNKYTRVIIDFTDSSRLFFNDLRIFGWVKVIKWQSDKVAECQSLPELKKMGPEANDEKAFTSDYFEKILSCSKKPVKLVIMDQEKLAGVGNIYANEALFLAGIRPNRPANSLSVKEIAGLRKSIIGVLQKAIIYKGTSDKDEAFRQISGEKGQFQNYLQVYGRAKEKCLKCGKEVKRVKLGGRGTFYCEDCQK